MMRLRFLFAATVALQCVAHSQKPLPPGAAKIKYVAHIPAPVMKLRPKTAITRFYGVTEIQGQKLALHFYDLRLRKPEKERIRRHSALDVFTIQQHNHFQRLRTVPITTESWANSKTTFSMAMMWLAPATKKQPIVVVSEFNRGLSGYEALDTLCTFAQGMKRQVVSAQFGSFWSESLSEGSVSYGTPDESGRISVLQSHRYGNSIEWTAFKWNGTNFTKFQNVNDNAESPLYHVWDGEKFVEKDLRKPPKPAPPTEKQGTISIRVYSAAIHHIRAQNIFASAKHRRTFVP